MNLTILKRKFTVVDLESHRHEAFEWQTLKVEISLSGQTLRTPYPPEMWVDFFGDYCKMDPVSDTIWRIVGYNTPVFDETSLSKNNHLPGQQSQ